MEDQSQTDAGRPEHTEGQTAHPAAATPPNLDLVLDIELPVWARFGQTEMPLSALAKLGPGATIDLDRSPEDPVDLLVNDTVVARGDVVVAGGHYGVRVTEVLGGPGRAGAAGPLGS